MVRSLRLGRSLPSALVAFVALLVGASPLTKAAPQRGPGSPSADGLTTVSRGSPVLPRTGALVAELGRLARLPSPAPTRPPGPRLASLLLPSGLLGSLPTAPGPGRPMDVVTQQAAGLIVRVSVDRYGNQGNGGSYSPVISPDGRYVAFESVATNLVASDTNAAADVLIHDLLTRDTAFGVAGLFGQQPNRACLDPCITAGARFLAFSSSATNLIEGQGGGVVAHKQVFLRDRSTSTMTEASVANDGTPGLGPSYEPSVSDDGNRVAFTSWAANLVEDDTNGKTDVFLRDVPAGTTTRVSVAPDGGQADDASSRPLLSADGRYLAFVSSAPNLVLADTNAQADVFLRDLQAGQTERVSVSTQGAQTAGESTWPSISDDGRYIAFASTAGNLVPTDLTPYSDVFVRDRLTGQTELASIASDGTQLTNAQQPSISGDGRYVTFVCMTPEPASAQGTSHETGIFVRDRVTGQTTLLELPTGGASASGFNPVISRGGRYVAFDSYSSALVSDDTNGRPDCFVYQRPAPAGGMARSGLALGPEPVVTGISPNSGNSGEFVTCTIAGQNLDAGATVTLRATWQPYVAGRVLQAAEDGTSLKVEFLLLAVGSDVQWDVYVVNPGSRQGVLPAAFTIEGGTRPLSLSVTGPNWVREGATRRVTVTVRNPNPVESKPTLVQIGVSNAGIAGVSSGGTSIAGGGTPVLDKEGYLLIPPLGAMGSLQIDVDVRAKGEWSGTSAGPAQTGAEIAIVYVTCFVVSEAYRFLWCVIDSAGNMLQEDLTDEEMMHLLQYPNLEKEILKRALKKWADDTGTAEWGVSTALSMMLAGTGLGFKEAAGEPAPSWWKDEWPKANYQMKQDWIYCAERFESASNQLNYLGGPQSLRGFYGVFITDDHVGYLRDTSACIRTGESEMRIIPLGVPWDPNCKAGPGADEEGGWSAGQTDPLVYHVFFENKAEATAAARNIVVTDQLSPNLDSTSLESLGGSHPQVLQSLFSKATGTLTWRMTGINLPPNKTPPEGEGWVAFRIQPKTGLPNGAEIRNKATIVFDTQPATDTNETLVRIDTQPPTSAVTGAEPLMGQSYAIHWQGDDGDGSGVMRYDIYLSENDGPYAVWRNQTADTTAPFEGRPGHSYRFISRATDLVGNVEAAPDDPDLVLDVPFDSGFLVSFDFNRDNVIDVADLAAFIQGWRDANGPTPAEVDPRFDLAPWRGEIPDIEALPDGKLDYQDAKLVLQAWFKLRGAQADPTAVRPEAEPVGPAAVPLGPRLLEPFDGRVPNLLRPGR